MDQGLIILITGAMAAGKSTVAQAVAERLNPSIHLRGDALRKMMVDGRIDMTPNAPTAAIEQLKLRYRAAAKVAREYSASGIHVVYQDTIIGPVLADVVELFSDRPLGLFVLSPRPDVIAAREAKRNKTGYTHFSVEALSEIVANTPKLGHWIDNSDLSVDETVEAILGRLADPSN